MLEGAGASANSSGGRRCSQRSNRTSTLLAALARLRLLRQGRRLPAPLASDWLPFATAVSVPPGFLPPALVAGVASAGMT
jgi:hypothetical protein